MNDRPTLSLKTPTKVFSMLSARAIKVVVVLDPSEVAAYRVVDNQPRVQLKIDVSGRKITADVTVKSLRKCQATIREAGTEGCSTFVQGKLGPGDVVLECGLIAQAKAVKPSE